MKNSRAILVPLFFVFSQSCTTESKDKLLGHWHKISNGDWGYQTLDIGDTVTITDKYDLLGAGYVEYPRLDKSGVQILPTVFYRHSSLFSIVNDTLEIHDGLEVYQYIKSDLNSCRFSDRYSNSYIDIALKNSEHADEYEVLGKQFCGDDLFIGKLRHGTGFRDSLSRTFPDSIFIQSGDILISIKDILKLCDQVRNICTESNNPMNINVHADSNVSGEFINQIESLVPPDFSMHEIVKIEGGDIGLIRMR